jgi:predicted DsbA family dithiol-disulfide isomerase/uncharacterized membrane protein
MMARVPPLLFRLALLVAVAVSTALLIDYARPLPAFCDIGSGCEQVRHSSYAQLFHVPLPVFGILGFGTVMVFAWMKQPWARRLAHASAIVGGLGGALLLLTQALVLHVFCKLCLAVDISAMVAGLCALVFGVPRAGSEMAAASGRGEATASSPLERWLWPAATVLALLVPVAWGAFQPSPAVPPEIASLWVPGKINVVEFADFQCPFCRRLHPEMAQLLDEYADRVHFVRLNMPLSMHPDARTAARAYCCAEDQGQATAMADALFRSESLSPEACEKLAASLGLSLTAYRACVQSAATDARIDEQVRRVRAAGLAGLPTVWIGSEVIVGLQPLDVLRAAFAKAAGTRQPMRWPVALALGAGLAAVAALALRRPPSSAMLR